MIRRSVYSLLSVAVACGCSAPVEDDADAREQAIQSGRYGLVLLSHEFGEPGVEVSAQLLDYEAPSRTDALHALAVPVEAWLTQTDAEPGCKLVSAPFEHHGHVDLLSAGTLTVGAPAPLELDVNIDPTAFPPLRFSLSGVVYDAAAPEALPYLAGGDYSVSAPGSEVGDFDAQVRAAGPVWIREIVQQDSALMIRWGGEGAARVVIARDTQDRTVGLVCTSDTSELSIDHSTLKWLGNGDTQVVVARLHRTPIEIEGLDSAEAVFVTRDSVQFDLGQDRR